MSRGVLLDDAGAAGLPCWIRQITEAVPTVHADQLSEVPPPAEGPPARHAAVLMLFAGGTGGAGPGTDRERVGGSVLLTQRAATMRSHAGQVSFPGGRVDPGDDGPVGTALREAEEETGLDPGGVRVLGLLPQIYLPPSHFMVTPVIGWWDEPGAVSAKDPAEVEAVAQVGLEGLLEPRNRFTTPLRFGRFGPAFETDGWFIWGFTAGLLSRVLEIGGLEREWNRSLVREVPRVVRPGP